MLNRPGESALRLFPNVPALAFCLSSLAAGVRADDWPSFRGGRDHAGVTAETLSVPLALDAMVRLDWKTGRVHEDPELHRWWSHSKTCAVPTASTSALYFRRNSCQMYDIASGRTIDLTQVTRPGCWMSIIPAGGLILMPEASSGCTCGFAVQTSVVLTPPRH